jgi:hypothetical protein
MQVAGCQALKFSELMTVTPEAAGSSPVDPANIHWEFDTSTGHDKVLWPLVPSRALATRQNPSF